MVRYFIEIGVNTKTIDADDRGILQIAAEFSNPDVVSLSYII